MLILLRLTSKHKKNSHANVKQVTPFASNLLFNGYAAWRGCIIESSLDLIVRKAIRTEFPYLGNCLYYCHGNNTAVPGQYAVLYVAGNDVLSWIVYETRENPLEIREGALK